MSYIDKQHREDLSRTQRPNAKGKGKEHAKDSETEHEDAQAAERLATVAVGRPPSAESQAEAMEMFREVNGEPASSSATASPAVGHAPSAESQAEVMEMFREVNEEPAAGDAPANSASAAASSSTASPTKAPKKKKAKPAVGHAPSAESQAEVMEMFREVNGEPGRGRPPSAESSAEVMEMFREVNGDAPATAAKGAPASASSNATPGVGRPPSAESQAEVMEMFREVNGDPAPATSAKAPAASTGASSSAASKAGVGRPPSAESSAEVMEMFREVNGEPGRGRPPSAESQAEVMEMFREVNGDAPATAAKGAPASSSAASSSAASNAKAGVGRPPSAESQAEVMEMFREVNGDAPATAAKGAPASAAASNAKAGVRRPPSAESSAEVMEMFREVNGEPGRGRPPSAESSAEVMEMFREVNGDAPATAAKGTPTSAASSSAASNAKAGVGRPPSAESSAEVMEMFREVNGEPGRGRPPSAESSAEVMEMFREVNGDPAPATAAKTAPASASAASAHAKAGVGRPPSAESQAEVMEMFREVNGGPANANANANVSAHVAGFNVQIGASAQIGPRAFTTHETVAGFDVGGDRLLAHEAAHVVQQGGGHELDPTKRLAKVAIDQAEDALDEKQQRKTKKKGDADAEHGKADADKTKADAKDPAKADEGKDAEHAKAEKAKDEAKDPAKADDEHEDRLHHAKADAKADDKAHGKADAKHVDPHGKAIADMHEAKHADAHVDGKQALLHEAAHTVDGHGMGLLVDPKKHVDGDGLPADPKGAGKPADAHMEPPQAKGTEEQHGQEEPIVDADGEQHAYNPMSGKAPAPKAKAAAAGGGFQKPAPKPELPPPPQTATQTAINAFIEKARADRDAAKAKVQAQQLAKSAHVSVDANAIAAQVKQKNEAKLADIRKKAEADKAKAAQEAAEKQKHEGPVTLESLKEKLESTATADKAKLKTDFDAKKAELTARLNTQKETLQAETKKQVDNYKKQQADKKAAAEASWTTQKKALETTRDNLQAEIRKSTKADTDKLQLEKQKLWKAAEDRLKKVDADTKANAAKVRADGEAKAKGIENDANGRARSERSKGQSEAATIRNSGSDDAESRASSAITAANNRAAQLELKGKTSAKSARTETENQAKKVEADGKKAYDDLSKSTSNQVNAVEDKIKGLGPLCDQKIKAAEDDLKKKLADGEKKLTEALKGTDEKIAKLQADGEAKIAKLQGEAETKLQKDYDAAVVAIDKRVEAARKQLATGNEKNLKALEKMVDQTCKALDKTVTDTEKKFNATLVDAEKQAQSFVLAQLHKIKAEADKALDAIDKNYADAMKQVDAAVEAAHRKLEETAKGKVLEIEVHIGTLMNEIGDGSRLDAAKKQLEYYIKEGKPIPEGYGETASPPPSAEKKDDKAAKPEEKKADEAKPDEAKTADGKDQPKETDAAAAARAELLKPDNLSPEGIAAKVEEAVKKGQKDTSMAAAETANAKVAKSFTDATDALTKMQGQKTKELDLLQAGDPQAVKEIEKVQADIKAGEAAAAEIDRAMNEKGFFGGKSPNKDAMLAALKGKTPEQIAALKEAYKAKTGRDLDADLQSEMSGDQLIEAKGHLSGDPVQAAVGELRNSGGFFSGDKDKMKAVLSNPNLTAEQRQKIFEEFEAQTGKNLHDFFKDELSAKDAEDMNKALGDVKSDVFDPNKPPPLAPGEKAPDTKAMEKAAADLRLAMDGWGTDEAKINETLKGKSPAEIFAIKKAFKEHYGVDLDKELEGELSGTALISAKAALKADPVKAAAASLVDAADGLGTDEKRIQDTLAEIKDPEQRRQVALEFERRTGQKLDDMLKDEMSGSDRDLAQAYAEGDAAKAASIKLDQATNGGFLVDFADGIADTAGIDRKIVRDGLTGAMQTSGIGLAMTAMNGGTPTLSFGGDADKMYEVLEGIEDPVEREKIKQLYKERTGQDLDVVINKKFSGGEKDACQAYLEGDMATASAARMKAGSETFWGTDEKAIYKQLEGKPEWQRKQIIAAYNAKYGGAGGQSFDAMIADEMSGLDLEKAQMLAKDGKVPPEFEIEYALDGIGTDEDAVKNALKGKSAKDIEAIRLAWDKRHPHGPSLDAAIKDDMPDGRDGFEVGMMLEGEPQPGEPDYEKRMLERAERKYKFDRSDGFSNGVMDVFSNTGADLDREHEKLVELRKALDNGTLTPEQKQQLDTALMRQDLDQTNYVASKNAVTENLATAAGVVVGAVVSVVTAGAAAPFVVAAIAALAGGAATMAVKMAMQGDAYGIEDMGIDAAKTLLQAATAGGMKYLGPGLDAALKAYGPIVAAVVQGALSGAIGGATNAAFDEAASRDLGDWLKNMLKGTAMGALGGAAGGVLGAVPNSGGKGLVGEALPIKAPPDTWKTAALKGMASSMAGAVGSAAVDPSMYEGSWDDIAKKWGKTVGQAAIQGVGDGITGLKEEHISHIGQQAADAVAAGGGDAAAQMKAYHDAVNQVLEAQATAKSSGTSSDPDAGHATAGGTSSSTEKATASTAKTEEIPAVSKPANDEHATASTAKTEEMPAVTASTAKTEEMPAVTASTAKTEEMPAVTKPANDEHAASSTAKTEEMPAVTKPANDEHAASSTAKTEEMPAVKAANDESSTGKTAAEEHAATAKATEDAKTVQDAAAIDEAKTKAVEEPKTTTEPKAADKANADEHATSKAPAEVSEQEAAAAAKTVEENAQQVKETSEQKAKQVEEVPDLQAQVDQVTGVDKGDDYKSEMQKLREMYEHQALEAEQVANVQKQRIEPRQDPTGAPYMVGGKAEGYHIDSAFEARRFSYEDGNMTVVTIKVHVDAATTSHLDPSVAITPASHAEIAKLKGDVHAGIDQHFNSVGPDGKPRTLPNGDRLNVVIEFVDNPADAHLKVNARSGEGRADQLNWYTDGDATTHAHELGHQMGLVDEYHDAGDGTHWPAIDRAQATSPGVHTDDSLMGNYLVWDPVQGKAVADPSKANVKQRHLDQVGGDITEAQTAQGVKTPEEVRAAADAHKAAEQAKAAEAAKVAETTPATTENTAAPTKSNEATPAETHAPAKNTPDSPIVEAPVEKPRMSPKELAAEAQQRANLDRENGITPEQRAKFNEIDQLALLATTPADFEFVRSLEAQAGRPVSERLSHNDQEAFLQATARQSEALGVDHETAMKNARQETAAKSALHDEAVDQLTAEVKSSIAKKDQEVTNNIVEQAKNAPTVNGRKEVTVDAAVSLGMGGAGAAGAHGDMPVGHEQGKARTDRIGIEDATKPELWGTLGHKQMGQEADAISYGTGGVKTSDIAEHNSAMPAKASDLALQVAAQRDGSGVGTVGSQGAVGPLEFNKVTLPDGRVVLEVGVPTRLQTGVDAQGKPIFETVLVKTVQGVDISTGMGPSRELGTQDVGDRKAQMTPEHAEQLKQGRQVTENGVTKDVGPAMMSGDAALALDAASFKGERVLGIGGGPTSEWAMEHALNGGATSVEIAGQMPRPKKGSTLGDALIDVENQIRAKVAAGEPVPADLTKKHHEIVTEHVANQRGRIAELEGKMNDGSLSGRSLEKAQQEHARLKAEVDPFLGSRVDRNHETLNNDKINHVQADVINVKPIIEEGGHPAIQVTYADGTTRVVDRVIPSIGANPDAPGGIHAILKNAPADMKLIPVISEGRCVGLESQPAGITISGAAMVGTLGTNMPPEVMKRIPPEMRDAVVASVIDHASREGVSAGSKGIVPGIENVGANTELTIEAIKRIPPEQRSEDLQAFLMKHELRRQAEFDGEARFPELQPKSGKVEDRLAKLDELEQKMQSPIEEERARAQAEHQKLTKDPEWQDAVQIKAAEAAEDGTASKTGIDTDRRRNEGGPPKETETGATTEKQGPRQLNELANDAAQLKSHDMDPEMRSQLEDLHKRIEELSARTGDEVLDRASARQRTKLQQELELFEQWLKAGDGRWSRADEHASGEMMEWVKNQSAANGKPMQLETVKPGHERWFDWQDSRTNAEMSPNTATILHRENPRKIELLEEVLHHAQAKIPNFEERFPYPQYELHVKDFMLRHHELFGLTANEVSALQQMLHSQMQSGTDTKGQPLVLPASATTPVTANPDGRPKFLDMSVDEIRALMEQEIADGHSMGPKKDDQ